MLRLIATAGSAWLLAFWSASAPVRVAPAPAPPATAALQGQASVPNPAALFTPSENCMACHNGLTAPSGENISIGIAWRSTIMANSSRDPYWQASIRRETIDHPAVAAEIEDECSVCHMPMSHTAEHAAGGKAQVFAHLPVTNTTDPMSLLAHDGVSCTLCHQVTPEKFGDPDSFTGGYVIDTTTRPEQRAVYGPFDIDAGRVNIMHSVTGFKPTQALHIRESELCATCHTLYTVARGASGEAVGRLPEQVPFLEWKHSRYASERSCQSCHMPVVDQPTPIASVLGQPREGVSRHTFLGGNFFVLRMLNAFRGDLGVVALPEELEAAAKETEAFLQNQAARISLEDVASRPSGLDVRVRVENLTGHKLPTAYPSRRAWIHLVVRDGSGRIVFESGALDPNGSIRGNDNDADPLRFEPHYSRITAPDQVEIYESILVDQKGGVTTGLLQGVTYGKDNRLLPQGFDKTTAVPDIAVHGDAASDATFTGGGDTVEYAIDTHGASGPFVVDAELLYQPIGYRWGSNLQPYTKAPEPARFISYFDSMRAGMTTTLARATSMAPARP